MYFTPYSNFLTILTCRGCRGKGLDRVIYVHNSSYNAYQGWIRSRFCQISSRIIKWHRYQDKWADICLILLFKRGQIALKRLEVAFFRLKHANSGVRMSTIWLKRIDKSRVWWNTPNSSIEMVYGVENRARKAFKGRKSLKMAKNALPGLLWPSSAEREKFFELSCRVGSVRNMVRSKICANQGNRTTPSGPNQENPYFPHFSPEFPRNKFENFFKNSYRTIVLTNSSKEVPKFFIKGENYKKTTEKLFSFLIFR